MKMESAFRARLKYVYQKVKNIIAQRLNEFSDYVPSSKKTEVKYGITKEYLAGENICRVTFRLPESVVPNAVSVCVVGNFNDWNSSANPMKKTENGAYTTKLDLERGREYQFRYLIDESKWENDWNADRYVQNPFGNGDNSVVVT